MLHVKSACCCFAWSCLFLSQLLDNLHQTVTCTLVCIVTKQYIKVESKCSSLNNVPDTFYEEQWFLRGADMLSFFNSFTASQSGFPADGCFLQFF